MEAQPAVIFELTRTFNYSSPAGGGEIQCSFIELREPTGKVSSTCCAIEGMIQSSLLKMSELLGDDVVKEATEKAREKTKEEKAETMDADAVLALLTGSGVDMGKLVLLFRELFKQVAWMGAEKQITSARLDEMGHKDLRRMIGEYTAAFILN